MRRVPLLLSSAFLLPAALFLPARSVAGGTPSFEEEVLPILKARCFDCHSTGKRKHGLDVRQRRLLLRGGDSGPAVVPGKAGQSLLFRKVSEKEMPPGEREKLSPAEIDRIRRWIESGAPAAAEEKPIEESDEEFLSPEDRDHWAFRPVTRPPLASFESTDRVRTPIDALVLPRLKAKGLRFAEEAEPLTLARRAFFDVIGLPPSPAEMEEFQKDRSPGAFERLLDRLLASPRYGERWARHWLDLAGYADSDGATDADPERPYAWKYRDYVIRSFNEDKPYDRFLEEQFAGDELAGYPGGPLTPAGLELLAATGYLRCAADGTGQPNGDPLRAQNQVVADTLAIFGSGILGLTLGCAQCHNHRYDPVSQRDYHRIRAALEPAYNMASWKTPAQRLISLYGDAERKKAAEVAAQVERKRAERVAREAELVAAVVEKVLKEQVPEADREAARAARAAPAEKRTGAQKALLEKYPSLNVSGGTLYQYDQAAADKVKALDAEIQAIAAGRPPEDFLSALWEEPGPLAVSRLFVRGNPQDPAEEIRPGVPAVLVAAGERPDLAPVPAGSSGRKTSGRRLALARWLTRPENPLTARVFVNRVWMHHFGRGLVATPGDFGKQGDPPTHPELLDWLAAELVRGGWRLKPIQKLILSSTVYRQRAAAPESLEADPDGDLLSRRPVLRLEGEAIRDAMLAVSGSLNLKMGGPPVSVREDADGSIVVGIDKKAESNRPGPEVPIGEEEFRRTIYIQSRRTRPLSFTAAFDVPVMETSCTRRNVSTSAPQALTLLNGGFARKQAELFARRLLKEPVDDRARLELAIRLAYARPPLPGELERCMAFLHEEIQARAAPPAVAAKSGADPGTKARAVTAQAVAVQAGSVQTAGPGGAAPAEDRLLPIWTDLCQVIYNSSEFIFIH